MPPETPQSPQEDPIHNAEAQESPHTPSIVAPGPPSEDDIEFYTTNLSFSIPKFVKGFIIDIPQYHKVEEWVIDQLLVEDLYTETSPQATFKAMQIIEGLLKEFPFLKKTGIPEVWSLKAREALVKNKIGWMKKAGEKLPDQVSRKKMKILNDDAPNTPRTPRTPTKKRKSKARNMDFNENNDEDEDLEEIVDNSLAAKKRRVLARMNEPTPHPLSGLIPFKQCQFVVEVLGSPEKVDNIALRDLVHLANYPADASEDIDPQYLAFNTLVLLLRQSGIITHDGDSLIYLTHGVGLRNPNNITCDEQLRKAAMDLRFPGKYQFHLGVVPNADSPVSNDVSSLKMLFSEGFSNLYSRFCLPFLKGEVQNQILLLSRRKYVLALRKLFNEAENQFLTLLISNNRFYTLPRLHNTSHHQTWAKIITILQQTLVSNLKCTLIRQ